MSDYAGKRCHRCGERVGQAADAVKELLKVTADRDEWKRQHENLLSVKKQDNVALSKRIEDLDAELDLCHQAEARAELLNGLQAQSINALSAELTTAERRLAECERVLEYYANAEHYTPKMGNGLLAQFPHGHVHDWDRGDAARSVLAALKEPTK